MQSFVMRTIWTDQTARMRRLISLLWAHLLEGTISHVAVLLPGSEHCCIINISSVMQKMALAHMQTGEACACAQSD